MMYMGGGWIVKINIIFHSLYGHVYRMAEAVAEGAREVKGATVDLYQVPETLSDEIIANMGAVEAKKMFAHIPVATMDNLAEYDAIIFGTPTRFGMMSAQMRAFLDATGQLWLQGALVGKVGSVFTSTATQHGGQETTIRSFHTTLMHHGMIIVGLPYTEQRQMTLDEISGGSPYGSSTIAGPDGSRLPSENELAMARFQGKHVAEIAKKLFR
jgi:NAD(P)H dehydrogenase (quinone)